MIIPLDAGAAAARIARDVSMRRRRRDQPGDPSESPTASDVIAMSIREMATLVEIFEYAHAQIAELSSADEKTIASASGSALIPALYARAGLASSQLRDDLPLLTGELRLLEAAVINLESYEGSEVMLCTGYELLDSFTQRRRNVHPLRLVHGILSFVHEARGAVGGTGSTILGGDGPVPCA